MSDIPLRVRWADFVSDLGVPVRAWRAYADVRMVARAGGHVRCPCLVDSGAPFSVIPFSVWHGRDLQWLPLGTRLYRAGQPAGGSLDWFGVPCTLGQAELYLVDPNAGVEVGPFLLVGKFAQSVQSRADLEKAAWLGINFVTDNSQVLRLEGANGNLSGYLSIP